MTQPLFLGPRTLPECDHAEAHELYLKARGGCKESRRQLIGGYTYLVGEVAREYVSRHRLRLWLFDDLFGSLQRHLCRVIDRKIAQRKPATGLKRQLATALRRHCIDAAIELQSTTSASKDTFRRRLLAGKPLPKCRELLKSDNRIAAKHNDQSCDLRAMIDACCETDRQLEIVRLRIAGYNDAEIAKRLGVSTETVRLNRKATAERLKAELSQSTFGLGA